MSEKKLPKGFTCECGMKHFFGGYVLAHWDIELVHTCQTEGQNMGCGRKHIVLRGVATLVKA